MESVSVDSCVVVVPAEGGEVVGLVGSALGAGDHMVDFEPVGAAAGVDDASVVSGQHRSAQAGAYLL